MEPTLKISEMGAWYRESPSEDKQLLGEAGNPSYSLDKQVHFLREGDEVLCTSYRQDTVIPASTTYNGTPLSEILEEGTVQDYTILFK